MIKLNFAKAVMILVVFTMVPLAVNAQCEQPKNEEAPPISQPLLREGSVAVNMVKALNLGTTTEEIEAENILGEAGIAPRNGWIADYPVTPDIVGELRESVADAADANRISLKKDEALKALQDLVAENSLSIKPYTSGQTYEGGPPQCENYPNPAAINNYYADQGPPVVTYYAPPPDFYYLYSWVPYPFWWSDFWFPGFFVLQDFHKIIIVKKKVVVITNHFVDRDTHKAFRVDPANRFSGRTFAGIGAPKAKGLLSTGIPRGEQTIFNHGRAPSSTGREITPPSERRAIAQPSERREIMPPSGGRMISPPSGGRGLAGPSREGGFGGFRGR